MNAGSIIVLVVILALCGLAVWRVHKKGAPCECGGSRPCTGGCAGCKGRTPAPRGPTGSAGAK